MSSPLYGSSYNNDRWHEKGWEAWDQARSFTKKDYVGNGPLQQSLQMVKHISNAGERKWRDVCNVRHTLPGENIAEKAGNIVSIQVVESASHNFEGPLLSPDGAVYSVGWAMGEPRRVATWALTGQSLGATENTASLVIESTHINSDLSWLRCSPKSKAALSTRNKSWQHFFPKFHHPDRTHGKMNTLSGQSCEW